MNLLSLEIKNFRNIEYADIELARSNFCVGHNRQGKSTIQNAIQFALFGFCEHTDRRGAGYKNLIREGAKDSEIVLYIAHGEQSLIVTSELAPKRKWYVVEASDGEVLEGVTSPDGLWQMMGIDKTQAMVCCFPSQIVGSTEFSGILSDRLVGALTPDMLGATMTGEHEQFARDFAKAHRITLRGVDDYTNLGAAAYARRTDVNRDIKLAEAAINEFGFLKPVTDPNGQRISVNAIPAIEDCMKERDALLRQMHIDLGRAQAAETAETADPAEIQRADALLNESLAALRIAERYEALENEQREAAEAVCAAQQVVDSAPTHCPTCGGKLSAKKRAEMTAEAQAALAAAQEREATASAAESQAERELPPDFENAETLRKRIADQSNELARLHRLPAPYKGATASEIQTMIETTDAEQSQDAARVVALNQHKQLADAQAHADALRAEVAALQWLVEQYHEGRAVKALLVTAADALLRAVNAALPQGVVTIEAEGKRFTILLDGREAQTDSDGGKAMVAYAFAMAFAECGAPVLLDNINDLDPLNRKALMTRLRAGAAGTIVFAGTPLTPDIPLAAMAGALQPMRVIHVDGGVVQVINVGGVAA